MAYARRDIRGGAVATTITSGITSGDSTFTLAASSGWPDGSAGDFFVVFDRGNAGEEKVRCASRSSLTVTVQTSGRGSDGTSASAHASGVTVQPCGTATDDDEANYTVSKTVGKIAAQGDILVGDAANSLTKLAKGTSGYPLVAGASTLSYAQLGTTGIANDAITSALIATDAVGSSEIADGSVTATELASDAVTTVKILNANVTTAKLALLSVDSTILAATAVTTAKIANAAVTETQLAASVAGNGLAGGAGTALSVNVDNSTLEIAADTLDVKAAGIGSTQLAAGIGRGALSSGYVAVTANQTGLGTGTDLTSLTVTVTVRASSRIRITGSCDLVGDQAGNAYNLNIKEGATVLKSCKGHVTTANEGDSATAMVVLTPSTGSHTYKLHAGRTSGTGGLDMNASSTQPAYILVEDLGA